MKRFFTLMSLLLVSVCMGTTTMKAAILSSTSDLRLELNRISDECIAGGPLLSLYTLDSRNSFVSETGDLYLSGSIVNPTSSPISFDPAKIKVAFSSSGSPYAGEVTKLDGTKLSAMTIPANDYLDLIIKMPTNWDAYMNVTSDGYSYLDLYIRYTEGSVSTLFSGSYCVTKGKAKLSMVVNMVNASDLYLQPIEVSRLYNGPYEDIMQYIAYTGNYYYMGYENLNVKFSLQNKTSQVLTLNSSSFGISYDGRTIYDVLEITDESYNNLSTISIPANATVKVIFHLGNEWYNHREGSDTPGARRPVRLLAYYNGDKTDGISYDYLFSREVLTNLSVSLNASNLCVKSIDEGTTIRSIQVVGSMGNVVKNKSFGSNCTEANVDLSNCQNGIYYIYVVKNNGTETAKIVKK